MYAYTPPCAVPSTNSRVLMNFSLNGFSQKIYYTLSNHKQKYMILLASRSSRSCSLHKIFFRKFAKRYLPQSGRLKCMYAERIKFSNAFGEVNRFVVLWSAMADGWCKFQSEKRTEAFKSDKSAKRSYGHSQNGLFSNIFSRGTSFTRFAIAHGKKLANHCATFNKHTLTYIYVYVPKFLIQ